jgi:NDP-sugar pyrophosphorylase family protein
VLDRIPEGRSSIERRVFPELVPTGRLFALASPAYWIDAGTPATYLQAHLDFLDGRRGRPPAPKAQERADGVWTLGDPVLDGRLKGPSLIGDAAFIAAHSVVERSVVGAGARVEDGAQVRDSVLLPGAAVRPGAVVDGSIVGERAVVGDGAHLSALTVVGGSTTVQEGASLAGARVAVGQH